MKNLINFYNCHYCKKKLKKISSGYDYEYRTTSKKWHFLACKRCDVFFLSPRPNETQLNIIYPNNYYSYNYNKINFFVRYGKKILDYLKIKKILYRKFYYKKNFYYLDIGCGSGQYLSLLNQMFSIPKKNIYGLEKLQRNKKIKSEFKILNKDLLNFKTKKLFDFISMFHVIEHIVDHVKILNKIKSLLKKSGILVIETPNTDSLDCKLFRNGTWGGYHFPRHWILYSTNSLKTILEKNGFECIKIFYSTGHSFWMYSFHNYFRKKKIFFLSSLFDPTKIYATPFLIVFTIFDYFRSKIGFKTSSVVIVARKKI